MIHYKHLDKIFKVISLKKNLFYLIALALLALNLLFFNKAYLNLIHYSEITASTNTSSFLNLSRQISNAVFLDDALIKESNSLKISTLLLTDSQTIIQTLHFLKSTVQDPVIIQIVSKLDSNIHTELSWILKSNVPDSIINHKSPEHLASLQRIDYLINQGLQRTNFLLEARRKKLDGVINEERESMILFITITGILFLYTTYNLRQTSRRKIKEKELEVTSRLLTNMKKIMDSSLDIICTIDEAGNFVEVSAASTKILGYTPGELIGKPYLRFVYSIDHQKTGEGAAKVMEGTNLTNFENRYVRKDGSLIPMAWSARWDDEEKIMYCVARDASEKLQNEAMLIASEKKYKSLFENNPLPMIIWDAETFQIVDCNKDALKKYGYTKEEFLQLTIKDIRPVEDIPLLEQWLHAAKENFETNRGVWRHKKKNGELMFVAVTRRFIEPVNGRSVWLVMVNDITEKLKAEQQAEFEKRDKDALINSTDDSMWSVNRNFELIAANKSFIDRLEAMTDIRVEPGDNLLISGVLPESYLRFWEEHYKKSLSGESFKKEIHSPASKVSKENWWEVKFNPVYEEGTVVAIACYARDITEKRLAEAAIKFRAELLNSVGQAVMATEQDGTINFWNKAAEKIFGWTAVEATGKNILELIPAEHMKNQADEIMRQLLQGDSWSGEFMVRRKDTTNFPVFVTATPFHDQHNNLLGVIAICSDITERNIATAEKEKLLSVLQKSMNEIYMYNADNFQFEYVNEAAIQNTGFSMPEIAKMSPLDIKPDFTTSTFRELLSPLIEQEREKIIFETIHKRSDGSLYPVEEHLQLVRSLQSPVFLAIGLDITERKKNEEILLAANEELRILTAHLQNIREEERLRIAREIHDELGQQLTGIKLNISWLNKKLISGDKDIRSKISNSIKSIDISIDSVRKIASELRPAILDDLGLSEAIEWQGLQFTKDTGIPVEFLCNVAYEKFTPDISNNVFRILQESLTNIARHANASIVTCTLQRTDDRLVLQVSDNGSGFNKDQQVNKMALGLLGMKERATMLKGKYDIVSTIGRGTIVSVEIPLQADQKKYVLYD